MSFVAFITMFTVVVLHIQIPHEFINILEEEPGPVIFM
jgi:hypothetical protein